MAYDLDAEPKSFLTTGNPKTAKGEGRGYLTAIMHLSPYKRSGAANVCAHASAGCAAACLNTAGRGGMGLDADELNMVQAARIQRTRFFVHNKKEFLARVIEDIEKHVKQAHKHGLKPCVRLNGTSDLPWENMTYQHLLKGKNTLFGHFPGVQFYDYTKFPIRLRRKALEIPNYHLSFSLSEDNDSVAREAIAFGVNVVVVFAVKRGKPLPGEFWNLPVIDGDKDDLRFLDPPNVIVGLRAKGRGIADTSGFVREVTT